MRMPDYVKVGEGPVTVFLLHGGYGAKEYWRHEIETLAKAGYRVIAWDAPGYGVSPLPSPYEIHSLAQVAADFVGALGGERNVLVGHSMGGIIAPKAAELAPDKVHAVVISATLASLKQGGEEFERDFIEKRVPPLRKVKTLAEAAMPLLKSMFHPNSSGELVDLVLDVAGKTPSETFIQAMLAITRYDGEPVVRALKVPVLVVGGRSDPVAQAPMVEDLAKMIPGAELRIFENSGHYPFAEEPDAFNEVLLDFLKRKVG
jgi:3-oxoadipate enol-lactonase